MCSQLEAILLKHRDISLNDRHEIVEKNSLGFTFFRVSRSLTYQAPSRSVSICRVKMEKVENITAIRAKNSFSIENILSRPDNSDNQRRLMRQNPFQNNHILFYGSAVNHQHNSSGITSVNLIKNDEKFRSDEDRNLEDDNDDHDTKSEAASDDGNSSVHSEIHKSFWDFF